MTPLASEMYVAGAQDRPSRRRADAQDDRGADEQAPDVDPTGAELRQPLGHVGPQRQAAPAHDDHEEDHEERRHAVEPGDEVLVEEVL